MADPAPTGTVVPAPQGGGSPEFQVPEGKVLIDAAEQQTWQRQREQLAGLTRFHGEATKRGFSKPDDFSTWDKFDQTLKGRKLTMDEALAILAGREKAETPEQSGGFDPSAIEKLLSDKGVVTKSELESIRSMDRATLQHEDAIKQEQSFIGKHLSELLGEKPTARDKYLLEKAVAAELSGSRSFYPEGHPLREHAFKPMTEQEVGKLIEAVKKNLAVEEGSDMSKIGRAASKGKPPTATPAGNRTGQGKPEDNNVSGRPEDVIRAAVQSIGR